MTKGHRPRRGSMAYYPRKRARSIVARIRRWPSVDKPVLLGFAGYKVGTLHVIAIEKNPNSPWYGQEVAKVATVIETPPIKIVGFRVYGSTPYGLKALTEVWHDDLPKDLERVFTVPKRKTKEEQLKKLEEVRDMIAQVRAIVAMQPRLAGIHKKKPEVFELAIGGSPEEALEYAMSKLGKEVPVTEVFSEGQLIDVIAVTKGKGFQGVVKRFNVKILPRWHKHRKGHRRIGSVGPTKPAIMFYTPFPGQMGFHQRTEYNKLILEIGNIAEGEDDINPAGGWPHYGLVRSAYVLLAGTVPGPPKRLIKMRCAIRPPKAEVKLPEIVYVSTRPIGVAK